MLKLTAEFIVSVLNSYNVDMSLGDAFKIGRNLADVGRVQADEAYQKGHAEGVKVPDYRAIDEAYDRGYSEGKRAAELNKQSTEAGHEMMRLKRIEQMMKEWGRELALDIVKSVGTEKKISCIKALRERTGLGLKDAKDIVEAACKIVDEEMAWEKKEEMERDSN